MSIVQNFFGAVSIKSELSLEEVADLLSDCIFSGLKFGGKERHIHEEIPCIFLEDTFLGLQVLLDGYTDEDEDKYYTLMVSNDLYPQVAGVERNLVDISGYIYYLMKSMPSLNEIITIMKPDHLS